MQMIDESKILTVLRMKDLIPVMRKAMIDYSTGRITQPTRRIIEVRPHKGFFGSMPAAGEHVLGAKLVAAYAGNAAKGLHTHAAVIVLFYPESGHPMAVMDGRLITEMRTAAVSAAFIDAAAGKAVETLAVLGAGVQGKSHIRALSHVRTFKEIRIWNRTTEKAEQLAEAAGGTAMPIEKAVRGADVVVVATSATDPVLKGKWLKPGARVVSVGWAGADGAEVDADVMAHVVVVDSIKGARTESGNIRRHQPEIFAELGEILNRDKEIPADRTVVFDSIGMACQDLAAASLVWDRLANGDSNHKK